MEHIEDSHVEVVMDIMEEVGTRSSTHRITNKYSEMATASLTTADLDNSEQRAIENALIKLSTQMQNRINTKTNIAIKEAGVDADLTLKTEMKRITSIVVKQATVTGYKVHKTKMAPLANGKYRTFILIEFPISLAYKTYLKNLEESTVSANIDKLKNTDAFKELEQYVSEFTG